MKTNTTKAKLKAGETVFGCFVRYPDASLVELLSYQAWDFIVFDAEHGTIEPRDTENMVRSAELHGVTPIVRVTTNLQPIILRYMDTGAQGLHVPWVNSAAEAELAVQSVKYHPRGLRGLAGVRAANYAQNIRLGDYIEVANLETLVVIHIETKQAVEKLHEILRVPDLDVIFIGPTDLSHSLGVSGQPQHPLVQSTIQRIVDIVMETNLSLGIMASSAEDARHWRDRGVRYVTIGLESILCPAANDYLSLVRSK